jgi:predicted Zn-dependent protease with MMP-like domain
MERESRRRGSIPGAIILALIGACVASPAAAALAHAQGYSLIVGLAVIAAVLLVPGYLATVMFDRDARRIAARREGRERHLALMEAQLAASPLPFECDPETFAEIVEREVAALPAWVQDAIRRTDTSIEIAEQREGEPFVLGLFSRRPVADLGRVGGGQTVDTLSAITLYRRPLIRAAGVPGRLAIQVRETLLHEVGHLLGMGEADLDRFTIGNNPVPGASVVRPRRR